MWKLFSRLVFMWTVRLNRIFSDRVITPLLIVLPLTITWLLFLTFISAIREFQSAPKTSKPHSVLDDVTISEWMPSDFHQMLVSKFLIADSALFAQYSWDLRSSDIITQRRVVIVTDVSGQPIGPIFKVKKSRSFLQMLTHKDGTDRLSWNVGTELPLYAA